MRQRKLIGGLLIGTSAGLLLSGCFTGGVNQLALHESLATDLTAEAAPRLARAQQADPRVPATPASRQQPAPPPLAPPPLPPANGTKQVSLIPTKNVRVSVRAWVNGKPIFDDEVMQQVAPAVLRSLASTPEPQRSERLTEAYNQALDAIIEQEVAYQDAVNKLKASNKKALDKLKAIVEEKYDEQLRKIREANRATPEQIREIEHILHRQTERNLISGEYVRSRIFPILSQQASHAEVEKYYKEHLNEFQRQDTVKWDDVFIAVGPKYPTVADARRFAEGLIAQCKTPADFAKLLPYNEGDSKFRNGEGAGNRKGEIKPPELEDTLFRLREGIIGPVIEMSTGVHIVRVTKREFAGQIPLDEKTQKLISNKIKQQVFEHEYKRLIRELKGRSTIEIMPAANDQ